MDVRQCLSDMGAELGIGDAADVVPHCLGQPEPAPSAEADEVAYLFPLALVVPGPQHIIDTATQRGLETLAWWPEWQRSAKIVCQWLRSAGHRLQLQDRLRRAGGDASVIAARVKLLDTSCDGFAEWRWKTIATVTKDLLRLRELLVAALGTVTSASDLSSRDAGTLAAVFISARDPQFWSRADDIAKLVHPMAALSSWIRGCECHERERLAGLIVPPCDWQGCRARSLGTRVGQVLAEVGALRQSWLRTDLARASTSMLASLDSKLAWLQHAPYLIWQVVC